MKKLLLLCAALLFATQASAREVWTKDQANDWYGQQKWLVGSNYIPADAINQLEMWQADSFNPAQIDKELGWAQGLGMTTMRVFLHDALWSQDPRRLQEAHGRVPGDRRPPRHQAAVRAVRQLLGPQLQAGPAASADPRRAQFRLGADRPAPRRWPIRRNMRGLKPM